MQHYDVIIVGGGLVGSTVACALSGQGMRIALVESKDFEVRDEPGYDDRTIALASGTRQVFEGMGLWDALAGDATPIHQIHVSERRGFGFTRLHRDDEGLPALGYVIPARTIGKQLAHAVRDAADIDLIIPATLKRFSLDGETATVEIEQAGETKTLGAALILAADGSNSSIREQLGIPVTRDEYNQAAIISNISPQLPHQNIAYERFTETGPMAVLPMSENRCAVVWTIALDTREEIMALPDDEFLARMQARFGYRLGRFERVGKRQSYPLSFIKAREPVRHRLALIGNAAHTLHPIAGQGFNLGVRDIAVLAEVLVDAFRAGEDIGDLSVLSRYRQWRRRDHQRVAAFTDGLARLYMVPLPGLGLVRSVGMLALDLLPPARKLFTRITMGRTGKQPRLSRGLPL